MACAVQRSPPSEGSAGPYSVRTPAQTHRGPPMLRQGQLGGSLTVVPQSTASSVVSSVSVTPNGVGMQNGLAANGSWQQTSPNGALPQYPAINGAMKLSSGASKTPPASRLEVPSGIVVQQKQFVPVAPAIAQSQLTAGAAASVAGYQSAPLRIVPPPNGLRQNIAMGAPMPQPQPQLGMQPQVAMQHQVAPKPQPQPQPQVEHPNEAFGPTQITTVLAFGDSLTCGAVPNCPNKPYTELVSKRLGTNSEVIMAGWGGDLATNMAARLQAELDAARQRGRPASHFVLLAGTNDLREKVPPEVILNALVGMHNIARKAGARCIAVTVPRFGATDNVFGPQTERRAIINIALREMAAASAENRPGAPPIWLADFDAALEMQGTQVRDSLFSDTTHLTERGYDLLGEVVLNAIMLAANGRSAPAAPMQPQTTMAQVCTFTPQPAWSPRRASHR
eukprot:TRINITY_DN9417_c0_g1_i2.p1 TRINITY_DN9417_c0_g1~~TRINITY_DN9417_c0_g1_i2.p1  ORF type:complete len:472 (-),score=54.56 TRINITY_DN9417_c0_g1_i2:102-1451(-)